VFDSHCHLDFEALRPNLSETLAEARSAGIEGFFVPGCHEDQWRELPRVRALGSFVVVGVGLHPYWSDGIVDVDAFCARLAESAVSVAAVAIGECGLDKGRGARVERQVELFEAQLRLAGEIELPVVIHQVGLTKELLESLGRVGLPERGGVVHGFSGDASWARALISRGLRLGIGVGACKPAFKKLRSALVELPLDRLLLETDAPDQGLDGGPGRPLDLLEVRDAIASLKGISKEIVAEVTTSSAREFYGVVETPIVEPARF